MDVDLEQFTVIFVWLQPWAMDLLYPKLAAAITGANKARVVSYMWPVDFRELANAIALTVGVTENLFLYELKGE